MENIKFYFQSVFNHLNQSVSHEHTQMLWFGIIMSVNYSLYYVVWWLDNTSTYESFTFRLIATLLCLALAFSKYLPKLFIKKYLSIYWIVCVTVCLPTFFTFMTLKNHASTLWLMNFMSALFFVHLLFEFRYSLFILILGVITGLLLFCLVDGDFIYQPGEITAFGIAMTIFAAIVISSVFARNRSVIVRYQLDSTKLFASSVAHELRTPLMTVQFASMETQKQLRKIIENPAVLDEKLQYRLETSFQTIFRNIKSISTTIDMSLLNIKNHGEIDASNFQNLSLSKIIEETLSDYPFENNDKTLINWNNNCNFSIKANDLLIKNIINNLIKNSLYYIREAGKGEISIWLETTKGINKLYFKDTAKGVSDEMAACMFDSFYSQRRGGTGVGLAYCKNVMESLGGWISVTSEINQFIQFELAFPQRGEHL